MIKFNWFPDKQRLCRPFWTGTPLLAARNFKSSALESGIPLPNLAANYSFTWTTLVELFAHAC